MTLEIITSDALAPVRHGFFTRRGGISTGVFDGLNCGVGSSDQTDAVTHNRQLVADAMNVDANYLASVYQYHSADVVTIDAPIVGDKPKADGMVTKTRGIALGILTADCAPILFADSDAGVIGACHSGWKGAVAGIGAATVDAMINLGATRENVTATIGPCISQRNYEVGPDFMEDVIALSDDNTHFFANGRDGKYQFDLPSFCIESLRKTGIKSVDWTGHCTYAEPDRFYSYRRMTHLKEPDYGRLISAITLD